MNFRGTDKELLHEFSEFFYSLGFFSELILVFLVAALLSNRLSDLIIYFIGISLNSLLNRTLKPLFKDLRPNHPVKFLASEQFIKNSNAYGLPSGHSQSSFFSVVYLYLTLHQFYPWTLLGCFIAFAMLIERWIFRNHTIIQLAAGAFVGVSFAWTIVYLRDKVLANYVPKF
jgi:hypothetical protein